MELRPDALRFVLAQGLPAVIEVSGRSMEPTILFGAKVNVAALAEAADLEPGDIVLLATSGDSLLLHRVMATFEEGGARFVVHQGDAPASTFGIAARRDVLARMIAFADDGRGAPSPEELDAEALSLFRRRRVACQVYLGARRVLRAARLGERPLAKRCARLYRRIARALSG